MRRKIPRPWTDFPLLPLRRCPECRKTIPDLCKKDGRWMRPPKNMHCSRKCSDEARRVGSRYWFERHRPHLDYKDFA